MTCLQAIDQKIYVLARNINCKQQKPTLISSNFVKKCFGLSHLTMKFQRQTRHGWSQGFHRVVSPFLILQVPLAFVLASFFSTPSSCGIKDNHLQLPGLEKRHSIPPNTYRFLRRILIGLFETSALPSNNHCVQETGSSDELVGSANSSL